MSFFQKIKKNTDIEGGELENCIFDAVHKLREKGTDFNKPGILLGNIQSGKTKAFIGIIARAFDMGYDITVVFTKGTKALARQTYIRLEEAFEGLLDDDACLFDIMNLPNDLTPSELKQKMILVVKKEVNNLNRLTNALTKTYKEALKEKTILFIDDEADYASVTYNMNRETGEIIPGRISSQIDLLRSKVNSSDYLQVTATPYSLYLQSDSGENISSEVFYPKRPAFTILLPIHSNYVGGKYYFNDSLQESSPAYYMYKEVAAAEREVLKKPDRRRFNLEEALSSDSILHIRESIINFIVGAAIRRIQEIDNGKSNSRYAFLVHTERKKSAHKWQCEIVEQIINQLVEESRANTDKFEYLLTRAYEDLSRTVLLSKMNMPNFDVVKAHVSGLLSGGEILIQEVNSEKQIETMLDDRGQLKLRVPLNIFIGGQILDRGITVRNLIGFYYGRRPQKFQQDTVLQHARMYGYRSKGDLAVTRFYTAKDIYDSLRNIHEFDEALRESLSSASDNEKGVVFIRSDSSLGIIPCSPNKILPSRTSTIKPFKRFLPVGFNTLSKTKIKLIVEEIDTKINSLNPDETSEPVLIKVSAATELIDLISQTIEFDEGNENSIFETKAALEFMSKNSVSENDRGFVWLITRSGRELKRIKEDGGYSDAPDTPKDDLGMAKNISKVIPSLIMIRQNGDKEKGWKGGPFWWPVAVAPATQKTVIFATDIKGEEA